jgi:hypothetical protein
MMAIKNANYDLIRNFLPIVLRISDISDKLRYCKYAIRSQNINIIQIFDEFKLTEYLDNVINASITLDSDFINIPLSIESIISLSSRSINITKDEIVMNAIKFPNKNLVDIALSSILYYKLSQAMLQLISNERSLEVFVHLIEHPNIRYDHDLDITLYDKPLHPILLSYLLYSDKIRIPFLNMHDIECAAIYYGLDWQYSKSQLTNIVDYIIKHSSKSVRILPRLYNLKLVGPVDIISAIIATFFRPFGFYVPDTSQYLFEQIYVTLKWMRRKHQQEFHGTRLDLGGGKYDLFELFSRGACNKRYESEFKRLVHGDNKIGTKSVNPREWLK